MEFCMSLFATLIACCTCIAAAAATAGGSPAHEMMLSLAVAGTLSPPRGDATFSHSTLRLCKGRGCVNECQSLDVAVDTCMNFGAATGGLKVQCMQSQRFCMSFHNFGEDATCANKDLTKAKNSGSFVCEECMKNSSEPDESIAYGILKNCKSGTPEYRYQCEAGCVNCQRVLPVVEKDCQVDPYDGEYAIVDPVHICGNVAKTESWPASTICEGDYGNYSFLDAGNCYFDGEQNVSVTYSCIENPAATAGENLKPWLSFNVITFMDAVNTSLADMVYNNDALLDLEGIAEFMDLGKYNSEAWKKKGGAEAGPGRSCDYTLGFIMPDNSIVAPLDPSGKLASGVEIQKWQDASRSVFLKAAQGYLNVGIQYPNPQTVRANLAWSFAVVCAHLNQNHSTVDDFFPEIETSAYPALLTDVANPFEDKFANKNGTDAANTLWHMFFIRNLTTSVFYPQNYTGGGNGPHAPSPGKKLSSGQIGLIAVGGVAFAALILGVMAKRMDVSAGGNGGMRGKGSEPSESSALV